jgi:hypothetical protein
MVRGQVEFDQFIEDLHTYGLLTMIRKYPDQFKEVLVEGGVELSKGANVLAARDNCNNINCLWLFLF